MLQDYLFTLLKHKWTRLLVLLLLLSLLAFQLSLLFWRIYPDASQNSGNLLNPGVGLVASVVREQSYLEQASQISRANLFGIAPTATTSAALLEQAPETKLGYKLRGIYYSEDVRLASAIVEIRPNNSNAFRVDEELAPNITVAVIASDHILINRYGKRERLNLEKASMLELGEGDSARDSATGSVNAIASTALLQSYKKRYVSNPMALANRFQAIPVQENGQNIGFQLKALRGESLLQKLNFEESDVFTKINGIGLDQPFEALDALKSLTTATSISVTILRNGSEETLDFAL